MFVVTTIFPPVANRQSPSDRGSVTAFALPLPVSRMDTITPWPADDAAQILKTGKEAPAFRPLAKMVRLSSGSNWKFMTLPWGPSAHADSPDMQTARKGVALSPENFIQRCSKFNLE